ncbi:hypothetical protein E2C01_044135 [Portunus trituberculatus]|uniref:Uncharacterized protein n=1 Tax=Portunus trituberculatus TaxID=210409 RepID=A0A5B7FR99_PORTR|nr:hypothetical protein [Portunus trituberculatus]
MTMTLCPVSIQYALIFPEAHYCPHHADSPPRPPDLALALLTARCCPVTLTPAAPSHPAHFCLFSSRGATQAALVFLDPVAPAECRESLTAVVVVLRDTNHLVTQAEREVPKGNLSCMTLALSDAENLRESHTVMGGAERRGEVLKLTHWKAMQMKDEAPKSSKALKTTHEALVPDPLTPSLPASQPPTPPPPTRHGEGRLPPSLPPASPFNSYKS